MPTYVPLKPLKNKVRQPFENFSVCDIESFKGWINFAAIGLAWQDGYHHFLNLTEFCEFLFSDAHPNKDVFAHFGGIYDFNFILREFLQELYPEYKISDIIPRASGILSFRVTKGERTIVFHDSSALLSFSLGSLTDSFKVAHKKGTIDYDNITSITPELLEYMKDDCLGLRECLLEFYRWPMIVKSGPAFTLASQALRVFRTFLGAPIPSLDGDIDRHIRASYFGGRTEVFKPYYCTGEENPFMRSFDANSLYPFVMKMHDYPTKFHKETQFYLEDRMGFYDVEVTVPEMYIPPLGFKYEGMEHKLIFPTGTFRGTWSTLELNYAMTLGVKINKVYNGWLFRNGGKIFEEYVDCLYDMRKKAKADGDSVAEIICKLLLNSCYGRFGLNLAREQLEFVSPENYKTIISSIDIPSKYNPKAVYRLGKVAVDLKTSFSNVAVAAWVTSAARTHMHKLIMQAPDDMYYMDTDSLKTTHNYPRNDTELGQLKLEYRTRQACYLLPKTYMEEATEAKFDIYDGEGKLVKGIKSSKKIVMKGFDKKRLAHFTMEDFISGLEGELQRLRAINPKKPMKIKTAMSKANNYNFLGVVPEQDRQIRTRYVKRRIYQRNYSQIWDTEPLHVTGGEIRNLEPELLKKWKTPTEADLRRIVEKAFDDYERQQKMLRMEEIT